MNDNNNDNNENEKERIKREKSHRRRMMTLHIQLFSKIYFAQKYTSILSAVFS